MVVDWKTAAEHIAGGIAARVGATVESSQLTDRLVQLVIRPPNADACSVTLLASPFDVVVEAGAGMRFELDRPLPESEHRVTDLVDAVASGGLREHVRPKRTRFELRLADGTVETGGTHYGLVPAFGRSRQVTYAAYSSAVRRQASGGGAL